MGGGRGVGGATFDPPLVFAKTKNTILVNIHRWFTGDQDNDLQQTENEVWISNHPIGFAKRYHQRKTPIVLQI